MSWKAEVIADDRGMWVGNLLRFATREEAEANVQDLARRWTLVREWRVVECEDRVTHAYAGGRSTLLVAYGMKAEGFANQTPCPHEGQWLKWFDHEYNEGRGYGEFTRDPKQAMRFSTRGEAMRFWQRISKVRPTRLDGKRNRPLTSLTVSIEQLP